MRQRRASTVVTSLVLVAALVTGCDDATNAGQATGDVEVAEARTLEADVDDGRIVLTGPDGRTDVLYELSEEDGEAVHVAIRPGGHDHTVVLALFRVAHPELGTHYELRYLVVHGDEVSDLYWFPWRLQVEARVAEVLDVPTLPVWAPDGSAIAWIEWDDAGTTLRIVGWHDDGTTSNPSDAVATYRLTDVPAGTQLDGWQPGSPAVFTGHTPDGEQVEIEVAMVELAMGRGRA